MGVHEHVERLLGEQRGLVAMWQLLAAGCPVDAARHASDGMRRVHDGVFLSGHAPLTDWQRWKAATLTAPETLLSDWSCGAFHGFWTSDRFPTTVRRPGSGGSRVFGTKDARCLGTLRVGYSLTLARDAVTIDDIEMLSAARTLLDLVAKSGESAGSKMVREALRLKSTTPLDCRLVLGHNRGRRGAARLRSLVDRYAPLRLDRTRSDAECVAIAVLDEAGETMPAVNVKVAGHEADLVRPDVNLIVELDGPQYHQFLELDAVKQAAWEMAGWIVRRLSTDDVYDRPELLIEATTSSVRDVERSVAAATRGSADVLARLERGATGWSSVRLTGP